MYRPTFGARFETGAIKRCKTQRVQTNNVDNDADYPVMGRVHLKASHSCHNSGNVARLGQTKSKTGHIAVFLHKTNADFFPDVFLR